jgi:hypothetical protein
MEEELKLLRQVAMEAADTIAEYDRDGNVSNVQITALRAVLASAILRYPLPDRVVFTPGDAADMAAEVRYLIARLK